VSYSVKDVQTPHGRPAVFRCRDGTSDLATVGASNRLWGNLVDEYLIPEGLTGFGLDIGAHIGSATRTYRWSPSRPSPRTWPCSARTSP
jgi:hypothetical protein